MKNPPGAASLPGSARNRMVAPARPRSPPARALPAGDSRIHWGLIRPYDAHAEFGEHVAYPRDEAARHNSVASSVWQRAEARNRSRAREPSASYPCPQQRSNSSDHSQSWAPQPWTSIIQPSPSDRLNRSATARHALDYPARDRPYEAQRPRAPSAAPLDGPTSSYEPSEDYRRRSTPPPVRTRNPPAHDISDSDKSDTETRPRCPYSPPRKAPCHADDAFLGHHRRSVEEYPEPPHGPYSSKQASAYPPEPEPSTSRDQSYAWPHAPRDFDNVRRF